MVSRSCLNLYDIGADGFMEYHDTIRKIPRVMTSPGIMSAMNTVDPGNEETVQQRIVMVANFLPLHSQKDPETGHWTFTWDEDALLLQMKDGFSTETEVVYVGSLKMDVPVSEQEVVSQMLLEKFNCIPTFLSAKLHDKYYHSFCKHHLWPLFHYMLPISPDLGSRFDHSLYLAYISANRKFADKVVQAMNSDDDYVWVHDYHLMLVPTFLRKRLNRVKIGFFLHSPFPSSEIYRTLPVREDILMALLNADLIGFHTFDYARHFLSCCSRMMGLEYESKRGYLCLEYLGRIVSIKILPVGVHMGRLQTVLNTQSTIDKVREIKERYHDKKLVVGIDDMDIFKGISLKLLAIETLLKKNDTVHGRVVFIQISNPPRSFGKDVVEAGKEVKLIARRINRTYGGPGYEPVILINDPIPYHEKVAYYAAADCCIVNAVRDGMNLVPYEYIVCRQGTEALNRNRGIDEAYPCSSALVVSEFVGCSPSLSGAIRVNPWNNEEVCEALYVAIFMKETEQQLRHAKHYRYVSSHHVGYWAASFIQDLQRACKDHYNRRCWGIGFGTRFRVIALSPCFRRLSVDHIVSYYKRAQRRAIFLDYDGTIMPPSSISRSPSENIISILNGLCNDSNNTVFIVSGRGQECLSQWLYPCENLGIAAEHGSFVRWSRDSKWESNMPRTDFDWREIAEPIMRLYTETTDGSYIESKRSALVWHHYDAGYDFGSFQAKELLDHLENVLANEPVVVTSGQHIVEVKPQGVGKGVVLEKLLSTMANDGKEPDFVLCIGDDRSDEDMFESINRVASSKLFAAVPEVFACTVGQKPSKAKYYVDDIAEVISVLENLASCQKPMHLPDETSDGFN